LNYLQEILTARFARRRQTKRQTEIIFLLGLASRKGVSTCGAKIFYRRKAMSTFYPASVGRIKFKKITL